MQLKDIIIIKGHIVLKTGLHIGGSKDDIEIGGIDSPVIKHPDGEPYIPGSSLKGKMRSLMEWMEAVVRPDGRVHTCGDGTCPVCRIFGTTNENWAFGPTRIAVRDAFMDSSWRNGIVERGLSLTEEKMENWINRLQGRAGDGGLRNIERVPAGARFDFEISYRVLEIDGDSQADVENFRKVLDVLRLVEMDSLGGSGSRGYGRVAFEHLVITKEGKEAPLTLPTADEIFRRAA